MAASASWQGEGAIADGFAIVVRKADGHRYGGHVNLVAVRRECRGTGLGKDLVLEAIRGSRQRGWAYLTTRT